LTILIDGVAPSGSSFIQLVGENIVIFSESNSDAYDSDADDFFRVYTVRYRVRDESLCPSDPQSTSLTFLL